MHWKADEAFLYLIFFLVIMTIKDNNIIIIVVYSEPKETCAPVEVVEWLSNMSGEVVVK